MIFKTPLSYTNFSSYLLATSDMDFIRFMGSILSFLVLWSTVLLAAKFLFRVQDPTWKYLTNFGMDITEIKILHSFWSSLIYAILNANSPTFTIYLTQGASYLFVGLIIGRHILNYR